MKTRTVLLLALAVGACALNPKDIAVPPGFHLTPTMPFNLAAQLKESDAVVQGTVTKVRANWDFDDPCGIFASVMHRCDGTRAYDVTVRTDRGDAPFMVFVPHNDFNPITVGLTATFLLKRVFAEAWGKCRQVQALTSTACESFGKPTYALLSIADVLPIDAVTWRPAR